MFNSKMSDIKAGRRSDRPKYSNKNSNTENIKTDISWNNESGQFQNVGSGDRPHIGSTEIRI